MNQGLEQTKNDKAHKSDLDQETIRAIIAQKAQEVQLEFQRLKLDEKRLEQDGKLSEKSMHYNSEFLKAYPKQHRQTLITYGVIIVVIFFGALTFIGYCIHKGDSEFAKQFLTVVTHIITLVIGLFVGKQSYKKKADRDKGAEPEEAEVAD